MLVDTIASAQNLHVARAAFPEYARQYPGRRMTLQIAAHVIDEHVPRALIEVWKYAGPVDVQEVAVVWAWLWSTFDLLELDGMNVKIESLEERRGRLQHLMRSVTHPGVPPGSSANPTV